MQEILPSALQALVSVLALFLFTKLMGKKQVSQLTYFDYVAGISIGSIAANFAIDSSISYLRGFTGLVIYALIPIVLSYLSLRSYRARKILDGVPTVIIYNGVLIESNLKKLRLTINDLLEECRLKDVFNLSDVQFAILETSGKISVQLKSVNKPLTPRDMNMLSKDKGLCLNVVIDGKVFFEKLKTLDKDVDWLLAELKKQNVSDPSNVLLAYVDADNQLFVHLKSQEPERIPLM